MRGRKHSKKEFFVFLSFDTRKGIFHNPFLCRNNNHSGPRSLKIPIRVVVSIFWGFIITFFEIYYINKE